jgi:hypothetical protein
MNRVLAFGQDPIFLSSSVKWSYLFGQVCGLAKM